MLNRTFYCRGRAFLTCLVFLLLACGTARSREIATFSLLDVQVNELRGPYGMRGGSRLKLGGNWFVLDILEDGRMLFREYHGEQHYGPFDYAEGRLMEIGQRMYEIREATAGLAIPTPRKNPAKPATTQPVRPPLSVRMQEWPVDAGLWLDVQRRTPLDWRFGGYQGSEENPLVRNQAGFHGRWGGMRARMGFSSGVELADDVVEESTSLPRFDVDDGSGWSLGIGYAYQIFEQDAWRAEVILDGQLSHDEMDLGYTSLQQSSSSTNSLGYTFTASSGTLEIEELSLWLRGRITYQPGAWGAYGEISGLHSQMDVSGSFRVYDQTYSLDADRSQAMTAALGGWYRIDRWRAYAEMAYGAEIGIRVGATYQF